MRPLWAARKAEQKREFYAQQEYKGIREEWFFRPCDPNTDYPDFLCHEYVDGTGRTRTLRILWGEIEQQLAWKADKALWEPTPPPADAYEPRTWEPQPERPPYPKPRLHLTFEQVKHAKEALAKWEEWDRTGCYPYKGCKDGKPYTQEHRKPPKIKV
jgi:hypothetical protein